MAGAVGIAAGVRDGTTKSPVLCGRRGCENVIAIETGSDHILAKDVDERVGLSHRRNIVEVQRIDVSEVLEHVAELTSRELDLGGRQVEPSQPCHFGDNLC